MNHSRRCFAERVAMLAIMSLVPVSTIGEGLSRKTPGIHHLMPLYEIAIIERTCSNDAYQADIKKSRDDCARELFKVVSSCTADHQMKYPRADNRRVGARLNHASFAALYQKCLKGRYAEFTATNASGAEK